MNRTWEKPNDLNKIELLKLQKDGLSVYQNLDELAAKDPNCHDWPNFVSPDN